MLFAISFSSSTTTIVTFISFFMPASYGYTCPAVSYIFQPECEIRAVQYFQAYIDIHEAHSLDLKGGKESALVDLPDLIFDVPDGLRVESGSVVND
jgi:hypothetical protein